MDGKARMPRLTCACIVIALSYSSRLPCWRNVSTNDVRLRKTLVTNFALPTSGYVSLEGLHLGVN